VVRRGGVPVAKFGLPLYDYMSLANLLQPCAAIAPSNAASPLLATISQTAAAARCASLVNAGVITGATAVEQAENAKSALHDYGYEAETDLLQASHWGLQATTAVVATYANAYSRSSVLDNLCGYSFATTSALGVPAAPAANPMLKIFGLGNGVPPTGGINLIQNNAANGPIVHTGAISASSGTADYDFDGANCLRQLYTGTTATSDALRTGVNETKRTANLQGKPAIILQGRSDTLVPVNHASRPYLGANKMVEGAKSELSYIEVMNANHFDAFLGLAGYDTRLIPLGYYKIQALNMMWAHLTSGAALPASQVVRTTPRGGTPGAAPALTLANLPPIATTPAVGDAINVVGSVVDVPN